MAGQQGCSEEGTTSDRKLPVGTALAFSHGGDSIFVTESGGIGINVGGHVIIKSLKGWHMLAVKELDDELAKL